MVVKISTLTSLLSKNTFENKRQIRLQQPWIASPLLLIGVDRLLIRMTQILISIAFKGLYTKLYIN